MAWMAACALVGLSKLTNPVDKKNSNCYETSDRVFSSSFDPSQNTNH